jgi:hypothetical protein
VWQRSVVLLAEPGGALAVRRAGPLRRLRARWAATRLDRALAAGASPDRDVGLALRAQQLAGEESRQAMVSALETLTLMARGTAPLGSRWAILSTRRLRAVADELEALAAALAADRAPDVGGLARVRLLLVDGDSPLYGSGRAPADDLRAAIAAAGARLSARRDGPGGDPARSG